MSPIFGNGKERRFESGRGLKNTSNIESGAFPLKVGKVSGTSIVTGSILSAPVPVNSAVSGGNEDSADGSWFSIVEVFRLILVPGFRPRRLVSSWHSIPARRHRLHGPGISGNSHLRYNE
jgi:hypothetical protein